MKERKSVLVVNLNLAVDKTAAAPLFRKGAIYRLKDVKTMAGGKGVNVARALQTLGTRSLLMGFIAGHNGQWIAEALCAEGFECRLIEYGPGESRVCFSVVDSRDGISTDYNEEGPDIPPAFSRRFMREFSSQLRHHRLAAFCGRISSGLPCTYFRDLIGAARRAGLLTALDTSGAALKASVCAGPALFKMNREEFETASGTSFSAENIRRFYRRVRRYGTEYVLVTNESGPGYAATPQYFWRFTPPKVKLVTPVGAGDSFMAGLVHGFSEGLPRQEIVRLAIGTSVSDCLTLGAGLIDARAAMRYAAKAGLERLSSQDK